MTISRRRPPAIPSEPSSSPPALINSWDESAWGEPIYLVEPPPPGFPGYGERPLFAPIDSAPRRVSVPSLGWPLLGTAVLSVLGAVLPWASVFGESVLGTAGDGQLVIACAVAVGACAVAIGLGHGRLWASLVALAGSLLITLIALVDIANVSSVVSADGIPLDGIVAVGGGLWLTLLAGVGSAGVAALAVTRREAPGARACVAPPGPAA